MDNEEDLKLIQEAFNDVTSDCDGVLEFLRSIPKSKHKSGRNQIMAVGSYEETASNFLGIHV